MNNTTIQQTDKTLAQTLKQLVPKIRNNLKKMDQIADRATTQIRRAIGHDLIEARELCFKSKRPWRDWLTDNFAMSEITSRRYMSLAGVRSSHVTTITEHLRRENPNYALPRQKVAELDFEPAVQKILSGISNDIFFDRALNGAKEEKLKTKIALEMVDAGYRALSIKAHSDKGGSDEAMRRLSEIRESLKTAIKDEVIEF